MSALFPFTPNYLDIDGHRMHYVDEGEGDVVLMLHGNPSWSFLYRDLIGELKRDHRAVAPDHIGCGRSDKPGDGAYDYTLASRVSDLSRLVEELDVRDITLVMHDWGGMIGMAWATRHADRIARLVVLNTAAFPLPPGKRFPAALALARVPGLGALLVRGANAFSRAAVRRCVTRKPMSDEVAAGYLEPYDSWAHRIAIHRFVQDIPLGAGDRAYEIVRRTAEELDRLVDIPLLICWGMKDFVFDEYFLDEWKRRFPAADVHRFPDCGHYVLEDAGEAIVPLVRRFLEAHPLEALV